ncbi:MAG TPA: hypothetical protein VIN09_10195 [Chloroflexota bacterium]
MDSEGQTTCGQGLAAHAVVPAKLAELMAALAEVLERHTKALDLTDPDADGELRAYTGLARDHRDIAARLAGLAQQMTSYRDLPMPRHDMVALTDPGGQMEAFQRYVAVEREFLALLQAKLKEEEQALR